LNDVNVPIEEIPSILEVRVSWKAMIDATAQFKKMKKYLNEDG
jgi:hypothetical protein